jgi:hypothetical protein
LIQVFDFINTAFQMIFDGLGKGDLVRRNDQFHPLSMLASPKKIQEFFSYPNTIP